MSNDDHFNQAEKAGMVSVKLKGIVGMASKTGMIDGAVARSGIDKGSSTVS